MSCSQATERVAFDYIEKQETLTFAKVVVRQISEIVTAEVTEKVVLLSC